MRETHQVDIGRVTGVFGKNSYRYSGNVEFDGITCKVDISKKLIAVLKYEKQYYLICEARWDRIFIDIYEYDSSKLTVALPSQMPLPVLAYRFSKDYDEYKTNFSIQAKYYATILMKSLGENQQRNQEILQYLITTPECDIGKYAYSFAMLEYNDVLFETLSDNKIEPELRDKFFQNVKEILLLGLNNEHSSSQIEEWFFLLLALDYNKGVIFAEDFIKKYKEAGEAGRMKVHNGSDYTAKAMRNFDRRIIDSTIISIKCRINNFGKMIEMTKERFENTKKWKDKYKNNN